MTTTHKPSQRLQDKSVKELLNKVEKIMEE